MIAGSQPKSNSLASPAMGHWGTCPPRLPASYFGDHTLREQIRKMYKNNAIFAQFLSIFGPFLSLFAHSFAQGVIIVPKMPERSPINFNSTCTSDSGITGS